MSDKLREALERIADFSEHYERTASAKMDGLYPEFEAYRHSCEERSDAIRLTLRDIARAALAATEGEWRTIESAPKDGTPVLVTGLYQGTRQWSVAWRTDDEWRGGASGVPGLRWTAWQPLPSSPKEG